MSAVNWTKISNNLADSTDWEYISSQIKKELKLDIDPAFSMYVFEEYLKLAHKKNNPCIKGAEFVSRTFNTKNLFFTTKNLDYEIFDKLIKFINKQLMEVNKINKKYEIVKFYDYYNDDKKNVNINVNNVSTSMSTNVNNDVNNNVNIDVNKKNVDIKTKIRKLQIAISQAKRRVKTGKGTASNLEKLQSKMSTLMSTMSTKNQNVINVNNDVNINVNNDVNNVNGGDRGGDITYSEVKNKERKKEGCGTMSTMSTNQKKKCQQKMSTTTHTFFSSCEEKNDRLQQSASIASNCVNEREFMNKLKILDDKSNEYAIKMINFEKYSINQLNDWLDILHNLVIFTQPIINNDFRKIEKEFNKIFELLDENTTTPFLENATMQQKKDKKRQMLFEIYNEAKTNSKSSLSAVYHFLLKFYGKKKDNGYNLDCPTYMDYVQYLSDCGSVYLDRANKIQVNITALETRIKFLKSKQNEDKKDEEDFDKKIDNIFKEEEKQEVCI